MGSTLDVYAISLERLTQAAGSGDQSLIAAIKTSQGDFLASVDEINDEAGFTCAEALAELVNGGISQRELGYLYGYAVKAICMHLGKELSGAGPFSRISGWTEEVDASLKAHGIPLAIDDVLYAGSPVRIPEPDDYPFIGHMTPDIVAPTLAAFQAQPAAADNEDLLLIRGWLEEAAKIPGGALVSFII